MTISAYQAIASLLPKPKCAVKQGGDDYTIQAWSDTRTQPTNSAIDAEITRLTNLEPMTKLRERRTELLVRSDWSQGNDVPDALKTKWKTYRQQLRDLPASSNPTLNADGSLNESSVTWPTEPS